MNGEKRLCRKCDKKIPWSVTIEGKRRYLQNRKFCLECSPWGKHNTSSHDPIARRRKANIPYAQWPDEWKKTLMASNYRRGQQRKEKLVAMSGGKCLLCGYDKSLKALTFHHRNPAEKIMSLDLASLAQHKWEDIESEWAKCDLLCANCHAEIH